MSDLLSELLAACRTSPRPVDEAEIKRAWDFAVLAHTGQKRKSGEEFITHPARIAAILASWNLDTTTIIAGLLHDTIEDGGALKADIIREFGSEVAELVDGVTKISNIRLRGSTEELFVENLRKMLLVMARDLRVIMVKLADRLHNLQTLQYLPADKQKRIALETLEIYAPLAERLGIGHLKGQLEDLSFPYVYPQEAKELNLKTKKLFAAADAALEKFHRELLPLLQPEIPDAEIYIRRKHLYSLFVKLQRPEIAGDLSKIHDIVAARIIVNTIEQCYQVLGLVHSKYHPVPYLGISDFIANPKPNGYQSLHTKIFTSDGPIVEIQIRTRDMHRQAEMGIAAHWQYSEAKSAGTSDTKIDTKSFAPQNKLAWVKQLASWQQDLADNNEYLRALKFDALQHRNLVFSPKGDVYDLPRGATPIDYAYAVHTKLGHRAVGAKVNNRLVALNHPLHNGDVVEILVDKKKTLPNRDWLEFVVTTTARHSISKSLKLN